MADKLEFKFIDWVFEENKNCKVAQIIMNGIELIEILREIEKPYAEAEGKPHLAGDYGYIAPKYLYRKLTEEAEGAELLCCGGCGDIGCWSVLVSVRADEEFVYWENFEQNHRDWTYPISYQFVRAEYEQALEQLKEFANLQ